MNKNESYIMLDGKKIPLTDEQVKQIRGEVPEKSPFDRADLNDKFYFVESDFNCLRTIENNTELDNYLFECGNYCTDEDIMKQHALHMLLNNLLWRYSMTHGGDKIELGMFSTQKYYIAYDASHKEFYTDWNIDLKNVGVIYFDSEETAEAAIEEIVKPFIAEHPDFDLTKM